MKGVLNKPRARMADVHSYHLTHAQIYIPIVVLIMSKPLLVVCFPNVNLSADLVFGYNSYPTRAKPKSSSSLFLLDDLLIVNPTNPGMGAQVSITNKTQVPLSISLWQISPLYYSNRVEPGGTFDQKTERAHFTIFAKIADDASDYTVWHNIIPIGAVVGGVAALGAAGAAAVFGTPAWAGAALAQGPIARRALAALSGAAVLGDHMKLWTEQGCIVSRGIYMRGHREFEIREVASHDESFTNVRRLELVAVSNLDTVVDEMDRKQHEAETAEEEQEKFFDCS